MLSKTFTFTLPGDPALWRFRLKDDLKAMEQRVVLSRDDADVLKTSQPYVEEAISRPWRIAVPGHDLEVEVGAVSIWQYGLVVRCGETVMWRSTDKPFREPGTFERTMNRMGVWDDEAAEPTEEERDRAERQAALRPSLYVDLAFGLLFFFVAREFGLVTAALTGAGATFALFLVNPFVRWDLLGGFAAFGAGMALISAGLAWGFQDDLAIKLRGTVMALIGMGVALFDAVVLRGGYLGERLALYMEWMGALDPRRASFALAGATAIIMGIDTPLAFILSTDQWIWYNAFLDGFIAVPILLGSIYLFARQKTELE